MVVHDFLSHQTKEPTWKIVKTVFQNSHVYPFCAAIFRFFVVCSFFLIQPFDNILTKWIFSHLKNVFKKMFWKNALFYSLINKKAQFFWHTFQLKIRLFLKIFSGKSLASAKKKSHQKSQDHEISSRPKTFFDFRNFDF